MKSKAKTEEARVLPARLEVVSQPLELRYQHKALIIRDTETGEEFIWVRSHESNAICPIKTVEK